MNASPRTVCSYSDPTPPPVRVARWVTREARREPKNPQRAAYVLRGGSTRNHKGAEARYDCESCRNTALSCSLDGWSLWHRRNPITAADQATAYWASLGEKPWREE